MLLILLFASILLTVLSGPASAATAYVKGCGTASGATSSTISCAPGAVSAGNLLVGAVTWNSNTSTLDSCSDGTNSYTIVAGSLVRDNTNLRSIQGFYAQNIASGSPTVTCTLSATTDRRGLVIHEVSGTATSGALDQATGQSQQNPGTGTDAVTSTAVTTTANGEYIFSASGDFSITCNSENPGTNFTVRNYSGCAGLPVRSESRIQTSAGSIAGTWTASNSADDFGTIILTLKEPTASTRRTVAPWLP